MEDFVKTVSSQTVVSLGIGADDYLASSLTGEFVDAVAESFTDIGRILSEWHSVGNDQERVEGKDVSLKTPAPSVITTKIHARTASPPPIAALNNDQSEGGVDFVVPRAFRILREDRSMDVPAPLKNRSERTMKDVMGMAQLDKSSGVFTFSEEDAAALKAGTKTLLIQIGDLKFSKDMFSAMTVEEVLCMTEENPVTLSFTLKETALEGQSIDLF
jgi:hypothetical protein